MRLDTAHAAFAQRLDSALSNSSRIALDIRGLEICSRAAVRVLVIDAALLESGSVDASAARQLTRRGVQVLLVFPRIGESAVPLCLQARAHGCVDLEVSPEAFLLAVEAVARGELWFPRWMTEPLYYLALSRAVRREVEELPPGLPHLDAKLTDRESQVMRLAEKGLTNKQIARALEISPSTVKKHLHNALIKHGIHRRRQLFW